MSDTYFKSFIPCELDKSDKDTEWKIRGLASTSRKDRQGEIVSQEGLDLSPIFQKRGVFNWDHKPGIENTVGLIDSARKTEEGLIVEGRLFKNHDKAKAIYQVMSSLSKEDRGRMGMSVEGVVRERAGEDGKIIKRAIIKAIAITLSPVNEDTHVDLAKSLGTEEFDVSESFQLAISDDLSKSLGVGAGYANGSPVNLSGGDVMAQESFGDKKKKKKLKKMDAKMAKSMISEVLNQLQSLYPDHSRTQLWETFKDRLNKRFPALDSQNEK